MIAPFCDYCQREMEPTAALAFWFKDLLADPEVFPWACRGCRTVRTESVPERVEVTA